MSAPAQVTEAHRVLARHLSTEAESVPHLCDLMAQAIADSEARTIAAAVAPLEARIKSDEELFHDIRMKLTASYGSDFSGSVEVDCEAFLRDLPPLKNSTHTVITKAFLKRVMKRALANMRKERAA